MAPAPLVPPDCDLQDFPFMPLHVARLRDSDMAGEETPEACWYGLLLWASSWHQLPAASLPDSDAVMTKLIGLGKDVKTFRRVKTGAMRHFVLCSDGRWYHPIVAEQALSAWRGKLEQRWRTECARIKKRNQRDKTEFPAPTFEEFHAGLPASSRLSSVSGPSPICPQGQDEDVPETSLDRPENASIQEREKGTGTGTGITKEEASLPAATDVAPADGEKPKTTKKQATQPIWLADPTFTAAWNACTDTMRKRSESREKTWPVWRVAAAKAGGAEGLLSALLGYLRNDEDVKRTGGPGFHLWLKEGRWEHWLGGEGGSSAFDLASYDAERARLTAELEQQEIEA